MNRPSLCGRAGIFYHAYCGCLSVSSIPISWRAGKGIISWRVTGVKRKGDRGVLNEKVRRFYIRLMREEESRVLAAAL
ncbi:hypothetical protein FOZ60_004126 [Perkinsus olseni]|uniref:Uncharacterized protein n=1 Tax=Perkinsus olseni TaxID=32597 RepID=A0A7J6NW71_PEROL|nr:hypothetical protein FOZ60_004126 [Perkinsus olseni]